MTRQRNALSIRLCPLRTTDVFVGGAQSAANGAGALNNTDSVQRSMIAPVTAFIILNSSPETSLVFRTKTPHSVAKLMLNESVCCPLRR